MVEYNVALTKKFTGKEALQRRLVSRLKTKSGEIPYINYGLDYKLFTYTNPQLAIQTALGINCKVDVQGSRIIYADVEVDIGGEL